MTAPSVALPETLRGIDFDQAFQDQQRKVTGINVFGKTMTVVGYGLAIAAAVALVAAAILLAPPAVLAIPVIASSAAFISGFGITAAPLVFGALISGVAALTASVLCAIFGNTTKLKTDHVANLAQYDAIKNKIFERVSELEKKQGEIKSVKADNESKTKILEAKEKDFNAVQKRLVDQNEELARVNGILKKAEEELQELKSKASVNQDDKRIKELESELIQVKQESDEKLAKLQAYYQPMIVKLEEQRDLHFKEAADLRDQIARSEARVKEEKKKFDEELRAELGAPKNEEALKLAESAKALKGDAESLAQSADAILQAAANLGDSGLKSTGEEYKQTAQAIKQVAEELKEKSEDKKS